MASRLLVPGAHRAEALLDDRAVARAVLTVEAAWVTAQHREALVPADQEAAARAAVARVDTGPEALGEIAAEAEGGGNPVIPLLRAYRRAAQEVHGAPVPAIHASLTSQDVMDTALALLLRPVRERVLADLARTGDALARLVAQHSGTAMVGRTLTQHALPVTFGLKAASWLAGVDDAAADVEDRAHLPLSFGGAAGTLAATVSLAASGSGHGGGAAPRTEGPGGPGAAGENPGGPDPVLRLLGRWAEELGLELPDGVWHTDRIPVVRVAGALAETTAALSRMANDVLFMSRPEVGEVREPTAPGRGVSSAMPQKQNPVLSVLLRRTGLAAPGLLAQVVAGASAATDERPDGGWHAEWAALADLAQLTAAAASHAAELTEGLTVDRERMAANLAAAGTGVYAERLVAELAAAVSGGDGQSARGRVQDAVRAEPHDPDALAALLAREVARGDGAGLPDGLDRRDAPAVTRWVRALLDPRGNLGATPALCDRAVARHERRRSS